MSQLSSPGPVRMRTIRFSCILLNEISVLLIVFPLALMAADGPPLDVAFKAVAIASLGIIVCGALLLWATGRVIFVGLSCSALVQFGLAFALTRPVELGVGIFLFYLIFAAISVSFGASSTVEFWTPPPESRCRSDHSVKTLLSSAVAITFVVEGGAISTYILAASGGSWGAFNHSLFGSMIGLMVVCVLSAVVASVVGGAEPIVLSAFAVLHSGTSCWIALSPVADHVEPGVIYFAASGVLMTYALFVTIRYWKVSCSFR